MIRMKEALPPIRSEMFELEGGSRDARAAFEARVRYFVGPTGEEFIEGVRQGRLTASSRQHFKTEVNSYFFSAFQQTFKLPKTVTPESFYDEAGKTAIRVVSGLADLTGLSISQDPFVDEINPHPPSPIDLVYHLAHLGQGRDVDLDFNVRRHFLLSQISASIEAISSVGIRDILSDMQFSLNERLYYKGEEGHHERYTAYSYHDPETNYFIGFARGDVQPDIGSRVYVHEFRARRIEGVGLVYTIRNPKEPEAATKKAIAKADSNGGIIKPDSVEDRMRMTVVALEGNLPKGNKGRTDQVKRVHKRVLGFMREYKPIKKIVPENQVDGDRGQGGMSWKRDKIYFYDTSALELVVVGESDHYNQTYAVGGVDPETGFYKGKDTSHKLYEPRKDEPAAIRLLPESLHHKDIHQALVARQHEIAEALKRMAEVSSYDPRQHLEELKKGEAGELARIML